MNKVYKKYYITSYDFEGYISLSVSLKGNIENSSVFGPVVSSTMVFAAPTTMGWINYGYKTKKQTEPMLGAYYPAKMARWITFNFENAQLKRGIIAVTADCIDDNVVIIGFPNE